VGPRHVDNIFLDRVICLTRPDPLKLPPRIKVVAKRIADAAGTAIDDYAREVITDEPTITDRWIGAVRNALGKPPRGYGRGSTGIMWQAKTLRSSSGRAAEERRHGADLLGVAEVHVGSDVAIKGFLGQAKRTEPGDMLDNKRWQELQQQAETMLSRSPASFVLVYSKRQGIRFIPAISVANLGRRDLFDFNSMAIEQFFQLHLACFIGDGRLSAPHISTLDDIAAIELLRDLPIDHFLHIIVRSEGP
jgi:hypothetical protein